MPSNCQWAPVTEADYPTPVEIYRAVLNHEEQYSIRLDYKPVPLRCREAGKLGPKEECLAYIEEVWTDLRPLSLRQAMARDGDSPPSNA